MTGFFYKMKTLLSSKLLYSRTFLSINQEHTTTIITLDFFFKSHVILSSSKYTLYFQTVTMYFLETVQLSLRSLFNYFWNFMDESIRAFFTYKGLYLTWLNICPHFKQIFKYYEIGKFKIHKLLYRGC